MKWLSKMCRMLGGLSRARSAMATLIAFVSLLAMCWLPWWACLMISILVTVGYVADKMREEGEPADVIVIGIELIGAIALWVGYIIAVV